MPKGDDDLEAYMADMRKNAHKIEEQLQEEITKERQVLRSNSLLTFLQDEVAKQGEFTKETQLVLAKDSQVASHTPLNLAPRFAEPVVLRDAKRFAALVSVAEAEKNNSDEYWKEWAASLERTSKARYEKAQDEAAKALERAREAEARAAEAELRAATLESSLPGGCVQEMGTRELKLDDLLLMGHRLGVRITLGGAESKQNELDSLMAEVAAPQRDAPGVPPVEFMLSGQQAPTFEEMLSSVRQAVRQEMEGLHAKMAQFETHAWEMSMRTRSPVEEEVKVPAPEVRDSLQEVKAPVREVHDSLRSCASGDLPGQIPETLPVQPPLLGDEETAWEPSLCEVWSSSPAADNDQVLGKAAGDEDIGNSCTNLVLRESSLQCFLWDLLSVCFVTYDVVITPLHVLGLPNNFFFNAMMWAKPFFWLLDIIWSFMSGYVHDGIDEVRLKSIAWRYSTTWLPLDFFLLVLDVCTLLLLNHGTFKTIDYEYDGRRLHGTHIDNNMVRDGRVLFVWRCLLALHLWKVHEKTGRRIGWRIRSQTLRIKLGIAHVVALIFLCCHMAACGFYAIGVFDDDQDNSWVEQNLVGKALGFKYMFSLQWSLAQFSVGTTEVYARSFAECAYSATVAVIASFMIMLLFGRVVTAILQVASTSQGKRQQQLSMLMEYLVQCQVPAPLRSRVWATARQRAAKLATSASRVHEEDVPILACLPHVLQSELRTIVYSPVLARHPFFYELSCLRPAVQSVQGALSERAVHSDHVLFSANQKAENMYFMVKGKLCYRMARKGVKDVERVRFSDTEEIAGPWFSEPSLWINWEHRGEMTAVVQSEMFTLEAKRFQALMSQGRESAELCARYAKAFANYAKECQMLLTDVYIDEARLRNIVAGVLGGQFTPLSSALTTSVPVAGEPEALAKAASGIPDLPSVPVRGLDPLIASDATAHFGRAAPEASQTAQEVYSGTFTHPTFGPDEIPMEVKCFTESQGCWIAEGQTEKISIRREGKNIIFTETSGVTQLEGQEMENGMLVGSVTQAGVPGGKFQFQRIPQV